jgi:hexulose-6-phosphate isomerase
MNRRAFLGHGAAAVAGASLVRGAVAADAPAAGATRPPFRHHIKKAVIIGAVNEATLKPLAAAGFDGVESTAIVAPEKALEGRRLAESLGLRVHSVLRGWAEFNSPKPELVKATWDTTAAALRASQAYGGDTVLMVPCRIGGMKMPAPWEFKVEFDPATGRLLQVVEGDNAPYKAYMEAHDHAWDTSQEQMGKLIDVAKETGVVIAMECVWNNLWVDPHHYAAFIDSFHSPWVKSYFDIANMVEYSPPQGWIRILRQRIAKCHFKGFKLNPDGHGGRFVDPYDDSIDWPEVRRALDEIDYDGWWTNEGSDALGPVERARRMNLAEAGAAKA